MFDTTCAHQRTKLVKLCYYVFPQCLACGRFFGGKNVLPGEGRDAELAALDQKVCCTECVVSRCSRKSGNRQSVVAA
ncbi:MAG TPA: hypothetical protein VGF86_02560 [Candidatus Tumulicola sp.]